MTGHQGVQGGGGVAVKTRLCDNNPQGRDMTQCSLWETSYVSFVGYFHSKTIGSSHMKFPPTGVQG